MSAGGGQDDPESPQNLSIGHKWRLLALMSVITFVSQLASSTFSPAVAYVAADLYVSNESILSFSVSIFLPGYALGSLVLAPISEIYGRRIVLSCANWFLVLWHIGCALALNIETLITCPMFAGMGGAGCMTLGAGLIADIFPIERRVLATAFGHEILNRKTYATVLIRRKTERLSKELGRSDLRSAYETSAEQPSLSLT